MKKLILIVTGLILLSACPGDQTANNSTANVVENDNANVVTNVQPAEDLKAYTDASMAADERVAAINAYVKNIEAKLPKQGAEATAGELTRKETDISNENFGDATNEKWAEMHTYYADGKLMRLKVYSPEGEKKTEEFYFYNDKPVFAFIESDGAGKTGDSSEAKGDKFYFGSEGLFAGTKADGSKMDASGEEFKKYAEKLPKEAEAFRAKGK